MATQFGTDNEFELRDGEWVTDRWAPPGHPLSKAPRVDNGEDIILPERYYSRETMELEWQRLWTRVWNMVGLVSDLAEVGDYFRCEVGRESFIVVRSSKNQIKAFYNVCPHRGNQVVYNEFGSTSNFVCAFHSWKFGLDGALKSITNEEMFPKKLICDRPGLSEVKVDTWAGMVFLNMDPKAEDLRTYLGVLPEHFAPYHLEKYRVLKDVVQEWDANWKTAVDAFSESYHSHVVHPQQNAMLDETRNQYDVYPRGHGRMITPMYVVSPREPQPTVLNEFLSSILQQYGLDPAEYKGPPHNVRKVLAEAKRKWAAKNGLDWSGLSDSQLCNFINYNLFPNVTLSQTGDTFLIQQWRAHATDPEKLYYHVIALVPPLTDPDASLTDIADSKKGVGIKLDLSQRPQRQYDNSGEAIGLVLDQDRQQVPRQQKALRSRGFKGMRFGREEIRIRNYLAEVDRYLAKP